MGGGGALQLIKLMGGGCALQSIKLMGGGGHSQNLRANSTIASFEAPYLIRALQLYCAHRIVLIHSQSLFWTMKKVFIFHMWHMRLSTMKSLLGFRVLLRFGILDDYNKMVVCVFKFEEQYGSCDKNFVTNESHQVL
jgi:hypothetical protein